jgi:hypothetical protein
MSTQLRNSLDTLQSFRNRLESNKTRTDNQIKLGPWTFTVDSEDNMVLKNGTSVHTTIRPDGSITSSAINVIGGLTLAGSILTGVTDKHIASPSRGHALGYSALWSAGIIDAQGARAPCGYSIAFSADARYAAASDGIDGSAAYGRVNVYTVLSNGGFANDVIILPPSGLLDTTSFGTAIRFSNNASRVFISEPGLTANSGAVHIYNRAVDNSWALSQSILAPIASGQFGYSMDVSASGRYLVVSAWQALSGTGTVYIYEQSGTSWSLVFTLASPNSNTSNYQFGRNVRFSNDAKLLAISATGSTELYNRSGTVHLYTKSVGSTTWTKLTSIVSPVMTGPSTLFGVSLEISDDNQYLFIADVTVPVGAPTGTVYIYMDRGRGWNLTQTLSAGRNAYAMFGLSMAERGGMLNIGSPGDNANGANSGAVMAFIRSGYTWVFTHVLPETAPSAGSFFGYRVAAADSDNFITSAPYDGNGRVVYFIPRINNFAGTILTTGNFTPKTANIYDVGLVAEPYTDLFCQNAPTVTSDRSVKKNIRPVERGLEFIQALQPVHFSWIDDNEKHTGFIGQEVADIVHDHYGGVVYHDDKYRLRPGEFIAPLVAAFKDLDRQVSELEIHAKL